MRKNTSITRTSCNRDAVQGEVHVLDIDTGIGGETLHRLQCQGLCDIKSVRLCLTCENLPSAFAFLTAAAIPTGVLSVIRHVERIPCTHR